MLEQQIAVYDESGKKIGMTFKRRANQLIGRQRAKWLDEIHSSICLLPNSSREDTYLDKATEYNTNDCRGSADADGKNCILCVAKKRVREKRNLRRHVALFVPGFILLLFLFAYYGWDRFSNGFCTGVILAWSAFLLFHIGVYTYPRLKGVNLLTRRRIDPVEAEYKKLERMEADKIATEIDRL